MDYPQIRWLLLLAPVAALVPIGCTAVDDATGVNTADSVISIAADPDSQASFLNMVTVLTLQRILAEERAAEFFGDQGPRYITAARGWKTRRGSSPAKS